jgi:hypothetical protein
LTKLSIFVCFAAAYILKLKGFKENSQMTNIQIRNQAKQYIDRLSPESLRFVNDFLIYLLTQEVYKNQVETHSDLNALELAGELVGSLEAPEDLSTNKKYFQGFGEC